MRHEDAAAVCEVHSVTFLAQARKVRGEQARPLRRTQASVLVSLEKDPAGCFVAEEAGSVIGCIMSRTWGSVGWFGTYAVLPEYQGQAVGKRLLAASLDYLRQDGDRVIGLETMPESPYNLGLYLKLGFETRFLTLLLGKPLSDQAARAVELPRWSEADIETRERWLADLRQASGEICAGLDYSKEIQAAARHSLGKTLLLTDQGKAVGCSLVNLVGPWEGRGPDWAQVGALMLHPGHTGEGAFGALLEASEALARAGGRETLLLSVNGRHNWALERLLGWGYRVRGAMVRMVLRGTDEGPAVDGYVNLSRWMG